MFPGLQRDCPAQRLNDCRTSFLEIILLKHLSNKVTQRLNSEAFQCGFRVFICSSRLKAPKVDPLTAEEYLSANEADSFKTLDLKWSHEGDPDRDPDPDQV